MTLTTTLAIDLYAWLRGLTYEEALPKWNEMNEAQRDYYIRGAKRMELRIKRFRDQNTDRSIPCPTCGFSVKTVERQPFIYRDDD